MAFDAAPSLYTPLQEQQLAHIDTLILYFSDEWRWTKGAFYRLHAICVEEALRKFHTQDLEDHILYAAQEVTGYAYEAIRYFNDSPDTTHEVLMSVLAQARRNIVDKVYPICPAPCSVPPPPHEGALTRIQAALKKPAEAFGVVSDFCRLIGYALTHRAEGPFAKNY